MSRRRGEGTLRVDTAEQIGFGGHDFLYVAGEVFESVSEGANEPPGHRAAVVAAEEYRKLREW